MFTGLIQGIAALHPLGNDRLTLSLREGAAVILSDLAVGDSVAVDGACLTVEEVLADGFVAAVSPETLDRTTLGRRSQAAQYVNLETSLRVGSKLGGHFVTGHIDGIGCLVDYLPAQKAWELTFAAPPALSEQWQHYIAPYLISKGSIAVNGISLTVADCDRAGSWFKTAVIPHTYQGTNLPYLQVGDWVNLEGDILGKYVHKLLYQRENAARTSETEINLAFLTEHGYG